MESFASLKELLLDLDKPSDVLVDSVGKGLTRKTWMRELRYFYSILMEKE